MDIKGYGYQRISSFDIYGYLLPLKIFSCISCNILITSTSFIDIQLFIHSYLAVYPCISIHILFFYPVLYPDIST